MRQSYKHLLMAAMVPVLALQSCDVLNDPIELDENIVATPKNTKVGIPLIDGALSLSEFMPEDNLLQEDENGFFYLSEQSSTRASDVDDIATAMGFDSKDDLLHVPSPDIGSTLLQIETLLQFNPGAQPDMQLILTAESAIDFEVGDDLAWVKVPLGTPESDNGYNTALGYMKFNKGKIVLKVRTDEDLSITMSGIRTHEGAEPTTEQAVLTGEILGVRTYEIDLTTKALDLWDGENNAAFSEKDLPAISIVGNGGKFTVTDFALTEDNNLRDMKVVFKEETEAPSITIAEQDIDLGFDMDFLNGGSILFNGENPDLKIGMKMLNGLGMSLKFVPDLTAYYSDGTSESIYLTDGNEIAEAIYMKGTMLGEETSITDLYLNQPENLLSITSERQLERVTFGGKAEVVSYGADVIELGEEIVISQEASADVELDAYIPIDAQISGMSYEVEADGINLGDDTDIPAESEGVLTIASTNTLPLDLGITLNITDQSGVAVPVPLNGGAPIIAGSRSTSDPMTNSVDLDVSAELLQLLLKSQKINLVFTLSSTDTDGNGTPDVYSQLNSNAEIDLKAGILLNIKEGNE